MKKDFLHHVWKSQETHHSNLKTSAQEAIIIYTIGIQNQNKGPDFLNARIRIADQLWVGHIAIHMKSSDWYRHSRQNDHQYNATILHVVWENDAEVFRSHNVPLPTLTLKNNIPETVIKNYRKLCGEAPAFIHCERDIATVDQSIITRWLEHLYFERLEEKTQAIFGELKSLNNDWEAVLFRMLMKNFGLKTNGPAFYTIAKTLDYTIVRKLKTIPFQLEALLFGVAGFLNTTTTDPYHTQLKEEYTYIQHKFRLSQKSCVTPIFSGLRPANFPTIRLAQFAHLYSTYPQLFATLMTITEVAGFYKFFDTSTAKYWENHYTFSKPTSKKEKKLSRSFIRLLIINTILPLKFCYFEYTGYPYYKELKDIINVLAPEENTITKAYKALNIRISSAMESQALLQLYSNYCHKEKCLSCAVGNSLLYPDVT